MLTWSLAMVLAAAPLTPASREALERQLGTGPVQLKYDPRGKVRLVQGKLGRADSGAVTFVQERQAALGLRADEALDVLADEADAVGGRHVRLRRTFRGLPVALDQLRVHLDAKGEATTLEAEVSDLSAFAYRPPTLLPGRARELATGGYAGRFLDPPRTDLVIVGERLPGVRTPRLAYRVRTLYPAQPGKVPVGEEVYVDAHGGAVLARFSTVFTAGGTPVTKSDTGLGGTVVLNATQYADGIALQDIATLQASGGELFTLDGSSANGLYAVKALGTSFGDPAAVSVADAVRRAVAFDLATFGWNKWNFNTTPASTGGTLIGVAHEGTNLANAFFTTLTSNGKTLGYMKFGDGDGNSILQTARCLDIAGHELGHGIVRATADLVYHNQSGALNEHFADVFGWLLDPGNDFIGEGCTGPGLQNKPLRDLCNPGNVAMPQPADMAHFATSPDTDQGDYGGVHVNSGIPNHAACLFRNATSLATVGQVWFQALTRHLGPTSSFQDMVDATATSCTELALGATTCAALATAWAQVGLGTTSAGGACPPNSTSSNGQCFCNDGFHVNPAKTGCEADVTVTCPANAHVVSGQCYCDTGFTPDAAGSSCVPVTSDAACGAHAHQEGGACACDECYQFSSAGNTGESRVCVAVPGCALCTDPLKRPQAGQCVCEPGTTPSGSTCGPVVGQCGDENYAGRCDGAVLVYCNDTGGAATEKIETIDCSKNPNFTVCGLENTAGSYNCVAPSSNCGTVPATGVCAGNSAQICDQGVLKSYDCGANGCGSYTYQGTAVQFCFLCPPHASVNGAGACVCDSGYQADTAGSACVATAGGCGTTAGGPPAVLVGLLGLAFLSRRRRS